jgi:hypothetical protein
MHYLALATDCDETIADDGVVDKSTLAVLDRLRDGALMYDPANHKEQALGDAPPLAFVERLRELGVGSLWVGRVIVATCEPNEGKVLSAIHDLCLNLQITFNKGAAMVLPVGVTKASGLRGALAHLGLSPLNCIGAGDAENDLAFLDVCGLPVAVASAMPSVKERAAFGYHRHPRRWRRRAY